ncbi:MAG: hypothetical protein NVS4B8_27620 [Herpetosiphon sp.]
MNAPQYLTDAEGNRTAVVLDLATYQEMLKALEDADDVRFYDEGKATTAGEELLSLEQLEAELARDWAEQQRQAAQ